MLPADRFEKEEMRFLYTLTGTGYSETHAGGLQEQAIWFVRLRSS